MRPVGPTIALIEDEPLVRVPLAQKLSDLGYVVLSAASGTEALTLLEDRKIAVAVIDVHLPGRIDGTGVAKEAKRLNPELKIIFITGKPPPAHELSGMGLLLLKPFGFDDLVSAIRIELSSWD